MAIRKYFILGLMLFALFLGAGNIIFPPFMGQMAGSNLTISIVGFLITGVGLPLLAVLALAYNSSDLRSIASRIGPNFGIAFTFIVYLTIGPFFGIPRTATVSYEIGVAPFLTEAMSGSSLPLFIFSLGFFMLTIFLALNPAKLVDRIGKILTPLLVIVIGALAIKSIITPISTIGLPQGDYVDQPFFESFIEGYLTMDVIGALVFGSMIIQTLNLQGIHKKVDVIKAMIVAGVIAAIGLAFVYITLAYIGATSVGEIGLQKNGGQVLALASTHLYGGIGSIILATTILVACLTTAVGLVTACAQFFSRIAPRFSYKTFVVIFATVSMVFANFGLTQLISISVPVLTFIYPIAIVLIFLSFIDRVFNRSQFVYICIMIPTGVVSLFDALIKSNVQLPFIQTVLESFPLYEQQLVWLVPAIIGMIFGLVIRTITNKRL